MSCSSPSTSMSMVSLSVSVSVEDRMAEDLSRRAEVGTLRSLSTSFDRDDGDRCLREDEHDVAVLVPPGTREALRGMGGTSVAVVVVDFASNDYLGLARCPRQLEAVEAEFRRLRRREMMMMMTMNSSSTYSSPRPPPPLLGATGSRLLSGDSSYAHDLERLIASYHGDRPAEALLFNSGYDANLSVLSCIPRMGDVILMDELCHNSLVMGVRMGRVNDEHDVRTFRHNDVDHLIQFLRGWRRRRLGDADGYAGHCYVVVESVYSMDGDVAPLRDICDAALEYGARVIVDEAHGLGVFGTTNVSDLSIPNGDDEDGGPQSEPDQTPISSSGDAILATRPLVEADDRRGGAEGGRGGTGVLAALGLEHHPSILCAVYTFGKAAGCHGAAVVCSSEVLKRYLVNYARPFVYSTALPPHSLVTIRCAYDTMMSSPSSSSSSTSTRPCAATAIGGAWDGEERRRRVFNLVRLFRRSFLSKCVDLKLPLPPPSKDEEDGKPKPPTPTSLSQLLLPSPSPIQSVLVPGNERCTAVSNGLRRRGLDVYPVRSPTVPVGTERIRIILHAHNLPGEVIALVDALVDGLTESQPPPPQSSSSPAAAKVDTGTGGAGGGDADENGPGSMGNLSGRSRL